MIIFPRCGPQCGKINAVVGNNAEKHTWTEIEVLFHVVGTNVEKLSVL